jgi:hypothetical protein
MKKLIKAVGIITAFALINLGVVLANGGYVGGFGG